MTPSGPACSPGSSGRLRMIPRWANVLSRQSRQVENDSKRASRLSRQSRQVENDSKAGECALQGVSGGVYEVSKVLLADMAV